MDMASPPVDARQALPATRTRVARGMGMCASPVLGLVAASSQEGCCVEFWSLPSAGTCAGAGGGAGTGGPAVAPTGQFEFLGRVGKKGVRALEFDFFIITGGRLLLAP